MNRTLTENMTFEDLVAMMPGHVRDTGYESEYYNAMRHDGIHSRAAERGITFAEQEAIENRDRRLEQAVDFLCELVNRGETYDEQRERQREHLASQPRGPIPEGKKTPCRHNRVKSNPWLGWHTRHIQLGGGFVCGTCGCTAPDVPNRTEPSEQAKQARRITESVVPLSDLTRIGESGVDRDTFRVIVKVLARHGSTFSRYA